MGMHAADRSRSPHGRGDDDGYSCGHSAWDLFEDPESLTGYTYDDLILLPGSIDFGVHEVDLQSRFSRNIPLKTPVVSSPMDTVTESKMAIALALNGGIGVIHKNMSIEDQVREVVKVKKHKSGFITDPYCVTATMTLAALEELRKGSGFTGFPVTADGKMGSKLLGLVTKRDTEFVQDDKKSTLVSSVMTPVDKLVTAKDGVELDGAFALVASSKKGKLPIVTADGCIVALVSQTDLKKRNDFPLATKSKNKTLMVAAAIGTNSSEQARIAALASAGVDALVIDQKQGDTSAQRDMIRFIKKEFPDIDVVGGNVVTRRQAKHLIDCGADALRVGMGVGSVSRAQEVSACGRAQASAVYHISKLGRALGIPVIADGGIGSPGQITKCLCMGASAAMCGSLVAGSEEAPGEYFWSDKGTRLKAIRGNKSAEILEEKLGRSKRSGSTMLVAHGVSGTVQDKGSMMKYVPYLIQSIKHGMQDIGAKSIVDIHEKLFSNKLQFELRSAAAQREGGIHDLASFERTLFS